MALCIRSGTRISRGSKLIAYERKLNALLIHVKLICSCWLSTIGRNRWFFQKFDKIPALAFDEMVSHLYNKKTGILNASSVLV
ncbi:hypothetical protein T4A_4927 [Trichinella pseudospiralis]|uniref:Uncharacterized protein n=1 Tax=Trichinella pseudospiralis TaxID=6337 RepID=A0A0V1DUB3_TRIPS|nr:hypothetical protein T4A_4927 [Trichinella pseudospiralis]